MDENRVHPELYTYFTDPKGWKEKFLKPELTGLKWDLYAQEELSNI